MPQLIKNINANLVDVIKNDLILVSSISSEIQREDYISFTGLEAFTQNLLFIEYTASLIKPLSFGLKNQRNLPIIELNINY